MLNQTTIDKYLSKRNRGRMDSKFEDTETKARKSYSQIWNAYNYSHTHQKILFLRLLKELTSTINQPSYIGNGRPQTNLSEMIFACGLKAYHNFSSRRSISDIKLAQQLGYINHAPHFNTILKYLNKPQLTDILMNLIYKSARPLKKIEEVFAGDASGFSTRISYHWIRSRKKYSERKKFKKAHVMCGVITNIIAHIEVTEGYVHDSLMLEKLIVGIRRNFHMKEVCADKGYFSDKNFRLIARKGGAIPYILIKKNVKKYVSGKSTVYRIMHKYFGSVDFTGHF